MRLNIGAGYDVREGYINVDWTKRPGINLVLNLDATPWPWDDNSVSEILALNLLEHLEMNRVWPEIYRILKPGGRIKIEVVNGESADPFHHTFWDRRSIRHLANGYGTPASPKHSFRKVDGPHYRHLPSGFPWWHWRQRFGFDLPPIPFTQRHIAFTLEKLEP
jgi:SAM-dependent methyltransferase